MHRIRFRPGFCSSIQCSPYPLAGGEGLAGPPQEPRPAVGLKLFPFELCIFPTVLILPDAEGEER